MIFDACTQVPNVQCRESSMNWYIDTSCTAEAKSILILYTTNLVLFYHIPYHTTPLIAFASILLAFSLSSPMKRTTGNHSKTFRACQCRRGRQKFSELGSVTLALNYYSWSGQYIYAIGWVPVLGWCDSPLNMYSVADCLVSCTFFKTMFQRDGEMLSL